MAATTREMLKSGIVKVTKLHSGEVMFEARWSWTGPDGTRRHGRQWFPTVTEARRCRARKITEIAEGRHAAPTRLTVGEYAETWFRRREADWATSTAYTRRHQWEAHLKPKLAGLRLTAVSRATCQAIVDGLVARAYKPSAIRNIWALLSSILRSATMDGLISRNPAQDLDMPVVRKREYVTWTPHQVRTFLAATTASPFHAMYYVMLTTGVRIGEAIALRWAHLDLDRGTVTITDTLRRTESGRHEPAPGTKTDRARMIVLTPGCVAALRVHRAAQLVIRASSPQWDIREFVFTQKNGRWIDQVTFRTQLQREIVVIPGLPQITPHGMRHSLATNLMIDGVQDRAIQDQLGHASISTTMDLYAHVTQGVRQATGARVASLFDDASATTPPPERVRNGG
ncbi:MAG: tyrosine-type recombinase/integrase [Thermomicrobiales bacterium]